MKNRKRPYKSLVASSFMIAFVLGISLCLGWVYMGITHGLCDIREDGTGWMKLIIDDAEYYCVPKIKVLIFEVTYNTILFILPTLAIVFAVYFITSGIRNVWKGNNSSN